MPENFYSNREIKSLGQLAAESVQDSHSVLFVSNLVDTLTGGTLQPSALERAVHIVFKEQKHAVARESGIALTKVFASFSWLTQEIHLRDSYDREASLVALRTLQSAYPSLFGGKSESMPPVSAIAFLFSILYNAGFRNAPKHKEKGVASAQSGSRVTLEQHVSKEINPHMRFTLFLRDLDCERQETFMEKLLNNLFD